MSDDREYEAGTPLDAEALAFAEKMEKEERQPQRRTKPAADPDPVDNDTDEDDPPARIASDADGGDDDADPPEPDQKQELARKMGWSPREQWRGPADQWVDADTFIDRASPRMLLERIDKLTKEHDETFQRVERVNKSLFEKQKKEHEAHIAALKRQRNEAVADEAAANGKEAAAELGDKWDEYIDKQKPPEAEAPRPAATGPDQTQLQNAKSAADAWIAKRTQYNTDPVFQAAAHRLMDKLKDEMPGQFEAQFAELDKRLAATGRFADIYTQPKNGGGVKVPPADAREMGGVRVGAKKDTNYAAKLPAAARSIGERMVKRGDIKNLEVYAKEYFANE